MIIVDTNVISELINNLPSDHVLGWLARQKASDIFTTAVTKGEMLYGIHIMPRGRRRDSLEAAVQAMLQNDFEGRVLAYDADAAVSFGRISASRKALGRPISLADAQIAAIVHSYSAVLATRNARDFDNCGIKVLNPWNE